MTYTAEDQEVDKNFLMGAAYIKGRVAGLLAAYGDNPEPTAGDFEFLVHQIWEVVGP